MKRKATLLSIFALCAILLLLPFAANAGGDEDESDATSGTCGDNLTWALDDSGTLTITGTGTMWDYSDEKDGNLTPWYLATDNINTVIIEDGVTSIGDYAFYCCYNLMSVSIPNSLISIGNDAFYYCYDLTNILVPESVTSIGENAFGDCWRLWHVLYTGTEEQWNEISISGGNSDLLDVTRHYECTGEEIIDAAEKICSLCLARCGDNLTWVLDANGTLTISGTGPMWDFLTDENYELMPWYYQYENIITVIIEDGVTSIGEAAFYACYSLTNITIPDSVTSIGEAAFCACYSLTNITIPDSVTSIGESAFEQCESLTNVTLSDGLTSISDRAFWGCNLTSITIPASVTSIGNRAFIGCEFTDITIPASVTSIGYHPFSIDSLESLTVAPGNTVYHSDGNCIIETASKTLMIGCKNSVIPVDGSVTNIGEAAFYACYSLTNITIPDSVTSIGEEAFHSCESLTSIVIPDSVTSIGEEAFYWCESLTSITIGCGVTSLPSGVFGGCYSVESLSVAVGNPVYHSDGNCIIETASKTLIAGCSKSVIPADGSVTIIGYRALSGFDLTNFEIPNTVTTIGDYAFSGSYLISMTIPEGVTTIGDYAFANCGVLTRIAIPSSVVSLGKDLFNSCHRLESMTVEQGNTVYHSDGNCIIETASKTLLFGCPNSIIPADGSVTSIGNAAFHYYYNLTAVIPDSVTSIGEYAFLNARHVLYMGTEDQWNAIDIHFTAFSFGAYPIIIHYECTGDEITVERTAPICGTDGVVTHTCTICGESYTKKIAATGHQYETVTVESTCTDAGSITYTCHCGDTYTEQIAATGHSYASVTVEPTCTQAGHVTYTCHCGDMYTEEIAAMGHSFVDGTCERCGQAEAQPGDVNGDGKLNARDARALLRYIAGLLSGEEIDLAAADFNGDGKINARDARAILRYAAGLMNADEIDLVAADYNGDGRINARDARAILRHAAGLE